MPTPGYRRIEYGDLAAWTAVVGRKVDLSKLLRERLELLAAGGWSPPPGRWVVEPEVVWMYCMDRWPIDVYGWYGEYEAIEPWLDEWESASHTSDLG